MLTVITSIGCGVLLIGFVVSSYEWYAWRRDCLIAEGGRSAWRERCGVAMDANQLLISQVNGLKDDLSESEESVRHSYERINELNSALHAATSQIGEK